jgi:hypothetical protein
VKALLTADSLDVFMLLVGLPAAALAVMAMTGALTGYAVLLLIWLTELLLMSWYLAIGQAIHWKRPKFSALGGIRFRMYLVLGFELKWVVLVVASFFESRTDYWPLVVLLITLLTGISLLMFACHLMADTIALIEGEGRFDPNRYTTATGELWFPPLGIWWLQPRIRAILLNPGKQDESNLAREP